MLATRPLVIPASIGEDPLALTYDFAANYAIPVASVLLGFWLLLNALQAPKDVTVRNTDFTAAAILAAIVAVLIHNTIDFAIFEPGVLTALLAMLAAFIAMTTQPQEKVLSLANRWLRISLAAVTVIFLVLSFKFVLRPVYLATANIAEAAKLIPNVRYELAHFLLDLATEQDPLSPEAPSINGKLYIDDYLNSDPAPVECLQKGEQALFIAIDRNPIDYKNFEALTETYIYMAQARPDRNEEILAKALYAAQTAVDLYPGFGRLRMALAGVHELLGDFNSAVAQYKKAVEIENAFREQFRRLYPDRDVFSRLGEENYQLALDRIEELSGSAD
jgi:tetratricopeptide (TPR) repeat protein